MDSSIVDLDEIIAIVAKKNKIIINERDPLLAVVTINEYIINHYLEANKRQIEELREELNKIHINVMVEAKENAVKIINASLFASNSIIDKNRDSSVEAFKKTLSQEVKINTKNIDDTLKRNNIMMAITSGIIFFGVILFASTTLV